MSNKVNIIFSNTSCPTEDILLKYVKGTLSDKDRRAVEEHLTDCEMCNDEIEGLSLLNKPEEIDDIVFKINAKVDAYTQIKNNRDYGFFFKIAATVILVVGLSVIVYYQVNKKKKHDLISENIKLVPAADEGQLKVTDSAEISKESNLKEEEKATTKDENAEIILDDIPQKNLEQSFRKDLQTKSPEGKEPKTGEGKKVTVTAGLVNGSAGYAEYKSVTISGDVLARDKSIADDGISEQEDSKDAEKADKKETDKGGIKTVATSSTVEKLDLAIVSGKMEKTKESQKQSGRNSSINDEDLKAASPAYSEYTVVSEAPLREEASGMGGEIALSDMRKEAIIKAKSNKYNEALILFESAPDQSVNDETSLFYEGLCYYKLNNPQRAYAIFKSLGKNSKLEIYNDIKWYYALTLISLNKKNDAVKVLKEISNSNSPYAPNAIIELDKLK